MTTAGKSLVEINQKGSAKFLRGGFLMWVVTVFETDTFRCFEYDTKEEAIRTLKAFKNNAILSFTN